MTIKETGANIFEKTVEAYTDPIVGPGGVADATKALKELYDATVTEAAARSPEDQHNIFELIRVHVLRTVADPENGIKARQGLGELFTESVKSLSGEAEYVAGEIEHNEAAGKTYAKWLVSNFTHEFYGAGKKQTDLSSAFETHLEKVCTSFATSETSNAAQTNLLDDLEEEIFDAIKEKSADGVVAKRLGELYGKAVDNLTGASEYQGLVACKSKEKALEYWNKYFDTLNSPDFGLFTASGIDKHIFVRHKKVQETVAAKSNREHTAFVLGGIKGFLEQTKEVSEGDWDEIVTAIVDSEDIRLGVLANEVLALVTDGPIAKKVKERQEAGRGGRVAWSLYDWQKVLTHSLIGLPLEPRRGIGDLSVKAGERHSGGLTAMYGYMVWPNEKYKTIDRATLARMILKTEHDSYLKLNEEGNGPVNAWGFLDSHIPAIERIPQRLESAGDNEMLHERLKQLLAISPWTALQLFAQDKNAYSRLFKLIRKGGKARRNASLQAFHEGVKGGLSLDELVSHCWEAGGVLPVQLRDRIKSVTDPFIAGHVKKAYTKKQENTGIWDSKGDTILSQHLMFMERFPAAGEKPPGYISALSPRWTKDQEPALAAVSFFYDQIFAEMESATYVGAESEREDLRSIAVVDMWLLATTLEAGGNEDLKNIALGGESDPETIRQRYLNRLADILVDSRVDYHKDVREMAEKIVSYSLAHWPVEDQEYFVDVIYDKALHQSGQYLLIEEGGWNRIMGQLALRQELADGRKCVGEAELIRPIATYAAAKTLELLNVWGVAPGRTSAIDRSIAAVLSGRSLGFDQESGKVTITRENHADGFDKTAFPLQAIDFIFHVGDGETKKGLEESLPILVARDMKRVARAINPVPANLRVTISRLERLWGNTMEAVITLPDQYANVAAAIAGLQQDRPFTLQDGRFVGDLKPTQLLEALTQEAQEQRDALYTDTDLQHQRLEVQHMLDAAVDQAESHNPVDILRAFVEVVKHGSTQVDPEVLSEVMKDLVVAVKAEGSSSQDLMEVILPMFSWNQGGDAPLAAMGLMLEAHAGTKALAGASFANMFAQGLADKGTTQQLLLQAWKETGALEVAVATSGLKVEVLGELMAGLGDESKRRGIVRDLRQLLLETETARIADVQAVDEVFHQTRLLINDKLDGIQRDQALAELDRMKQIEQSRIEAARQYLEGFDKLYSDLISQLSAISDPAYRAIVGHATRVLEWLTDMIKDDGDVVQMIKALEVTGARLGINLTTGLESLLEGEWEQTLNRLGAGEGGEGNGRPQIVAGQQGASDDVVEAGVEIIEPEED
ncbi:hypothetical protein ACFLZ1_03225 [Patescibacteria group bacterium]